MALDLKEISEKFDKELKKETRLSLLFWLLKDRIRQWFNSFKKHKF